MIRPIEIFFSYAHEDETLMDDVRRQLIGYDRRNIIRKWHDRLVAPGMEWRGQIDERLNHSDIILLFISPHFIESDYCYEAEMTEAMRRHESGQARVIPVILRPCLWRDEPFGRLQAVPTDGRALTTWPNRDEGALNAAQGIMNVVRQIISTPIGGFELADSPAPTTEVATPSEARKQATAHLVRLRHLILQVDSNPSTANDLIEELVSTGHFLHVHFRLLPTGDWSANFQKAYNRVAKCKSEIQQSTAIDDNHIKRLKNAMNALSDSIAESIVALTKDSLS